MSANVKAAEKFWGTLDRLLVEENCLPEQIFNRAESSLLWKQMPKRTFIHKETKSMPGFRAFKGRITTLIGGNVAGYKLKPFVIFVRRTPGPSSISVTTHCRCTAGAIEVMDDTVLRPELLGQKKMEKYCLKNNNLLIFCLLLIMLMDSLLLLVIFTPVSKWWFSLHMTSLRSNQGIKE